MKQIVVRASGFWLPLACILTLSSPLSVRSFLYRQLYPLVPVTAHDLAAAPDELRQFGYREDDPADLAAFRSAAESALPPTATDAQRLRLLGDVLYSLRGSKETWIAGSREQGIHTILAKMQRGEWGLCGHTTLVYAALWRSLGRDFREIRFTSSDESAWFAAHYGIEVYSPTTRRWLYYDTGLNGYAVGDNGEPLSLTALNEQLASGRDVGVVANPTRHDWDTATFLSFLRRHQLQVFSTNNQLRGLDADRRFGPLHFAYSFFSRLPRPLARVVDAVTGDAGPRLLLSKQPPPPAERANLHLTASPIG